MRELLPAPLIPADAAGYAAGTSATPSGTTQSFDLDGASVVFLDLGSATGDVTVSFANYQVGKHYTMEVTQGVTPRNVVLPVGTLQGLGAGTTVTISTTNDARDSVYFYHNGTNFVIEGVTPLLG